MPTRPTKGDHGHADAGSRESGNQKATHGSGVSPEVARAREELDPTVDADATAEERDG